MTPVVIQRETWRCGGPRFDDALGWARLLNPEGMKCCLGFVCLVAGLTKDEIAFHANPRSTSKRILGLSYKAKDEWLNTRAAGQAMSVNDDQNLSPAEREAKVKKLLAKAGYDVTFAGKYPDAYGWETPE